VSGIKLELPGHVKGDFELTKRHYVHNTTTTHTISSTTESRVITGKLSGNIEEDVESSKRYCVPTTNTSTATTKAKAIKGKFSRNLGEDVYLN
jgi:hypothetical protein